MCRNMRCEGVKGEPLVLVRGCKLAYSEMWLQTAEGTFASHWKWATLSLWNKPEKVLLTSALWPPASRERAGESGHTQNRLQWIRPPCGLVFTCSELIHILSALLLSVISVLWSDHTFTHTHSAVKIETIVCVYNAASARGNTGDTHTHTHTLTCGLHTKQRGVFAFSRIPCDTWE